MATAPRHSLTRIGCGTALMQRVPPLIIVIALLACLLHAPRADAQARAKPPVSPIADLRAVYATPEDVAEGKRIAESTCLRCHSISGVSGIKGVPHLAGQRPAYLHAKLRAYQTGARTGHEMEPAVKYLNEDAIIKVAAYYGSLEPSQPAAAPKPAALPPDPLSAGKSSASACGGCHGETGVSAMGGMPNLAGLDPKYFVAAMAAYKGGQRKSDVMQPLTARMGEAEFKNLALYYALQKPARASGPAGGDAGTGKAAAAACAGCHGDQGVSSTAGTPSIAGQDAQYHVAALRAYKDGSRKDETMKAIAAGLSDQEMKNVAAYYAAQEPRAPKVDKPLSVAEWVQRCDRCHGLNGNSTDPRTPALAGQRVEYLEKSLKAYQAGARKDSLMTAMSATLTETDMQSLAAYYSRQRARAFVYVMVPAK